MIPKTHLDAFSQLLAQLMVREADLEKRMAAASEDNEDRLVYLIERAVELNRHDETVTDKDFQNLDRFLAIFGLRNIIEPDDHIEQPFLIAVFTQYQSFLNEARAIKSEAIAANIDMLTLNIQYYMESLADKVHWAQIDPSTYKNEEIRQQVVDIKAISVQYIAETMADVEGFEKEIAMQKLYLRTFQKETLN